MDGEEGTNNGDGTECSEGIQCLKNDVDNVVQFGIGTTDVAGWSSVKSEGFRTYKRRKHVKSCSESKLQDDGRAYAKTASPLRQQPLKEQQGVVIENTCEEKPIRVCIDGLNNCSQRPWKIVLEHMYQSLSESEGGMQECIRDAVEFYTEVDHVARAKPCDHHIENRQSCSSSTHHLLKGFQKEASGQVGVVSNEHLDSLNHHSITEMCHHTCFDVLTSETFSSLCKLLFENFHEIKIDRFFDFTLINSRMKAGVYNHSPRLFLSDVQQGWGNLQAVGAEMVSIAKKLSDISSSCYNKQFCPWEFDSHTKMDQEDCCEYKTCTCRLCGDKADGRDCLVCDSCEEMYHVSCIEPAVEEIPPKSWYCATCTACGMHSPHDNCVVCERMNKTVVKRVGNGSSCTNGETLDELGDNLNRGIDEERISKMSKRLEHCKICDGEIHEGEKSKICIHIFCPNKFYHARCLTKKQLKSYGSGWYCPSCLCRSCLIDKDDNDIIICDGCDHAYHIYCLKPERTTIPDGQWFCRSCDAKLQALRTAKRAYENSENKQKKKGGRLVTYENRGKWKSKGSMGLDKGGGGMEMLLTAVNTLNNEEELAGI